MKRLLLLLLFFPSLCNAQIVVTIAGTGSISSTGEGGAATAASVGFCTQGIFDKYGNLYIAEQNNCKIRRISPSGIITTFAGTGIVGSSGDGGPATAARLKEPSGLTFDTSEAYLYFSDQGNHTVRKIDMTTGIISAVAGVVLSSGYNGDGIPAISAKLFTPGGLTVDSVNSLYIADYGNNRVRKIDASGVITTVVGTGLTPYGGDGGLAASTSIFGPCRVKFHGGYLYVTDRRRVMRVDAAGIITTYAGDGTGGMSAGDGGPATAATMTASELEFDTSGNLYIGEYASNHVIRKVNPAGVISTVAGIVGASGTYSGDGAPPLAANFNNISGLAFDTCGNLVVSDFWNKRIRKIFMNVGASISVAPGDTVCVGTAVTYAATFTGGSAAAYKWYKNGTVSGTGSTYTYTPANGDSVRCVVTLSSCGYSTVDVSSNTIHMVIAAPTVPAIALPGVTAAAVGSTVTVNATVSGAGSSYNIKWFRNGSYFTTTSVPMVTYTKVAGTDTITARIIPTGDGCYDSVTSAAHLVLEAPAGVAPLSTTAGLVVMHPNPARDVVYVYTPFEGSYVLKSIDGRTLSEGSVHTGDNMLSLHSLPPGIYLAEIATPTGEKVVKRVVRE